MKDIAALTVFGALKGFCLDAPRQSGGGPGRLKFGSRILLRDFRTVRRGEVVNFNIGTAAHAPGTLAVLKKHLGDDLQITVWADAPLSEPLAQAIIKGHQYARMLESGKFDTVLQLAQALKRDRSAVARTLSLVNLCPEVAKAVFEGTAPESLTLKKVFYGFPDDWEEQKRVLGLR